jgi:hypothetical protein
LIAPLAPRGSRLAAAYFVVTWGRKACPLVPCTLLASLAEAGACGPLPSSLARRRKACLLARSSRTAARQPGSARRRGIRISLRPTDARRASLLVCVGSRCRRKPESASGRSGLNDRNRAL